MWCNRPISDVCVRACVRARVFVSVLVFEVHMQNILGSSRFANFQQSVYKHEDKITLAHLRASDSSMTVESVIVPPRESAVFVP